MRRPYSRAFDPPAPVVLVRVRAPGGSDTQVLEGKLDSGADLSAVPAESLALLDLPPVRVARAAGFLGGPAEVVVHRADFEIDGIEAEAVEVLSTRRSYVIIGRNVLRALILRLDGPGERLDLRRPPRRSR